MKIDEDRLYQSASEASDDESSEESESSETESSSEDESEEGSANEESSEESSSSESSSSSEEDDDEESSESEYDATTDEGSSSLPGTDASSSEEEEEESESTEVSESSEASESSATVESVGNDEEPATASGVAPPQSKPIVPMPKPEKSNGGLSTIAEEASEAERTVAEVDPVSPSSPKAEATVVNPTTTDVVEVETKEPTMATVPPATNSLKEHFSSNPVDDVVHSASNDDFSAITLDADLKRQNSDLGPLDPISVVDNTIVSPVIVDQPTMAASESHEVVVADVPLKADPQEQPTEKKEKRRGFFGGLFRRSSKQEPQQQQVALSSNKPSQQAVAGIVQPDSQAKDDPVVSSPVVAPSLEPVIDPQPEEVAHSAPQTTIVSPSVPENETATIEKTEITPTASGDVEDPPEARAFTAVATVATKDEAQEQPKRRFSFFRGRGRSQERTPTEPTTALQTTALQTTASQSATEQTKSRRSRRSAKSREEASAPTEVDNSAQSEPPKKANKEKKGRKEAGGAVVIAAPLDVRTNRPVSATTSSPSSLEEGVSNVSTETTSVPAVAGTSTVSVAKDAKGMDTSAETAEAEADEPKSILIGAGTGHTFAGVSSRSLALSTSGDTFAVSARSLGVSTAGGSFEESAQSDGPVAVSASEGVTKQDGVVKEEAEDDDEEEEEVEEEDEEEEGGEDDSDEEEDEEDDDEEEEEDDEEEDEDDDEEEEEEEEEDDDEEAEEEDNEDEVKAAAGSVIENKEHLVGSTVKALDTKEGMLVEAHEGHNADMGAQAVVEPVDTQKLTSTQAAGKGEINVADTNVTDGEEKEIAQQQADNGEKGKRAWIFGRARKPNDKQSEQKEKTEMNSDLSSIMAKRREMAESGKDSIDESIAKKKEGQKSSTMSSDLSAIMARRRNIAESEKGVADLPEKRGDLKASKMNSEMQAALERRRATESGGVAEATVGAAMVAEATVTTAKPTAPESEVDEDLLSSEGRDNEMLAQDEESHNEAPVAEIAPLATDENEGVSGSPKQKRSWFGGLFAKKEKEELEPPVATLDAEKGQEEMVPIHGGDKGNEDIAGEEIEGHPEIHNGEGGNQHEIAEEVEEEEEEGGSDFADEEEALEDDETEIEEIVEEEEYEEEFEDEPVNLNEGTKNAVDEADNEHLIEKGDIEAQTEPFMNDEPQQPKRFAFWSSPKKTAELDADQFASKDVDHITLAQESPSKADNVPEINETIDAFEDEPCEENENDIENQLATIESAEKKKDRSLPRSVIAVAAVLCLMVGIGAGVGIGIVVGGGKDSSKPAPLAPSSPIPAPVLPSSPSSPISAPVTSPALSPTIAPTTSSGDKATYNLLCPLLPNCSVLLDDSTPQGQAYSWMLNDTASTQQIGDETKITRFALATFFYSTNGGSWAASSGWLSSDDACTWFSTSPSASCDGDELVALELDNNNVQGEIPFEMSLLTSLRSISLRNPGSTPPNIGGQLPTSLGELGELRNVTISGNSFEGGIPTEFGRWTNLETLDLSYNGLDGIIPTELASCSQLSSINLGENNLTGEVPSVLFDSLPNLVQLQLGGNLLTGSVPDSISKLAALKTLNLAGNKLRGFPLAMTTLSALESLDLRQNGLGGQIPTEIGNMVGLKELYLSFNNLSGLIPTVIGKLTNMKNGLDLSDNGLSGPIPSEMGNLVKLRKLWLNANNLTGTFPISFVGVSKISTIRIDQNSLTGTVPSVLCTLYDQLKPASYADCEEISASCFSYCCTDGQGCVCRFETTDPLRCLAV